MRHGERPTDTGITSRRIEGSRPIGAPASRGDAARLLREMRVANYHDRREMLEWLIAGHPGCRPAVRMFVQVLLACGEIGDAEALCARSLLIWPDDAELRRCRARCLAARGQNAEAWAELQQALRRRPRHVRTLTTTAAIGLTIGRHAEAVQYLKQALVLRPSDECIAEQLVEAYLAAGRSDLAEALLATVRLADPLLAARMHRAQRQNRDAVERLEAGLASEYLPERQDQLLESLIAWLDEDGDWPGIEEHSRLMTRQHPRAMQRLALARLSQGRFRTACVLAWLLHRRSPRQTEPLAIFIVAASLAGRTWLARWAHARLNQHGSANRSFIAQCWRRGLLGRWLHEEIHGALDANERSGMLQPLLRRARAVFESKQRTEHPDDDLLNRSSSSEEAIAN